MRADIVAALMRRNRFVIEIALHLLAADHHHGDLHLAIGECVEGTIRARLERAQCQVLGDVAGTYFGAVEAFDEEEEAELYGSRPVIL